MVLFEVDPERVTVLKFERYAPWAIHVNGVTPRVSMKSVKIKSRNIHILRTPRAIQSVEPPQASSVKCLLNTTCPTFFE